MKLPEAYSSGDMDAMDNMPGPGVSLLQDSWECRVLKRPQLISQGRRGKEGSWGSYRMSLMSE